MSKNATSKPAFFLSFSPFVYILGIGRAGLKRILKSPFFLPCCFLAFLPGLAHFRSPVLPFPSLICFSIPCLFFFFPFHHAPARRSTSTRFFVEHVPAKVLQNMTAVGLKDKTACQNFTENGVTCA